MKLIDKSVLVAEITKRVKEGEIVERDIPSAAILGLTQAYKNVLSFINTLEVKDVDLEKEIELVKGGYEQVDVASNIFPELKESEDERTRKELIQFIKNWKDPNNIGRPHDFPMFTRNVEQCDRYIAWLLKAKVQSKQDKHDITEPKFKVGDWVIFNNNNKKYNIYRIERAENYQYTLRHILGVSMPLSYSSENMLRLWTVADAKDGDILYYKDEISLYKHDIKNCTKEETTFGGFVYHCCYDGKRFITDSFYSLTEQDKMDIHPATTEQRNILFLKMKEAGYEWDSEKKEPIRRI